MPTEATTAGTETTETGSQGTGSTETGSTSTAGSAQPTTSETPGQSGSTPASGTASTEPIELPEDHPLVKALTEYKAELKTLRADKHKVTTELEPQVEQLKSRVAELEPVAEQLTAAEAKYSRLEAFLLASGTALSKALDSRTFTEELFNSDKDVKDIVKEWNAANPSATSTALGSGAAAPASKAPDLNTLLRAAAKS